MKSKLLYIDAFITAHRNKGLSCDTSGKQISGNQTFWMSLNYFPTNDTGNGPEQRMVHRNKSSILFFLVLLAVFFLRNKL